jgi:hypothetical protein
MVSVPSGFTVSENARVSVAAAASVTRTVKFDVPATIGVPVIAPVTAPNVRPSGRDPEVIDHAYGVEPPDALSVKE